MMKLSTVKRVDDEHLAITTEIHQYEYNYLHDRKWLREYIKPETTLYTQTVKANGYLMLRIYAYKSGKVLQEITGIVSQFLHSPTWMDNLHDSWIIMEWDYDKAVDYYFRRLRKELFEEFQLESFSKTLKTSPMTAEKHEEWRKRLADCRC